MTTFKKCCCLSMGGGGIKLFYCITVFFSILRCLGNETVHDECNFLVTDYDSNCGVLCVKCSGAC